MARTANTRGHNEGDDDGPDCQCIYDQRSHDGGHEVAVAAPAPEPGWPGATDIAGTRIEYTGDRRMISS